MKFRGLAAFSSVMAITLAGCGEAGMARASVIAATPPSPADTPAGDKTPAACVSGTWTTVAPDPGDPVNSILPLQFESQHFAFRYNPGTTTIETARAAAAHLESVWTYFIDRLGFPEPDCAIPTKLKANVFVGMGYGLSGSIDGAGHMAMWIGPGALKDHFGLAHEFTHALQGSTGSLRDSPYAGWIWESHANWMALQLPEFHNSIVHCAAMQVNYPHLYLGSTRMRYCNWQFMEYLKDKYGYAIINDIWRNAPKPGSAGQATGDPFTTLMANRGWTVAQMNDEFGTYAMHNVNWDYTNPDGSDQGAFYRAQFGGYGEETNDRIWRTTSLDAMDVGLRRFSVQPYQAPQRWGYNLVRVYPDAGATSISVAFRGVVQSAPGTTSFPGMNNEPSAVPAPNSGWRWGLVAIDSKGASRYSPLQNSTSGSVSMAVSESDKAVYMVVMGAPSQMAQILWDQAYYSIYRYPWMVQFTNAMPAGYQAGAPSPVPGGHRHPNGGGWIADGVTVPDTAYVGPYARVLGGTVAGKARIQDHAVVVSGTVQDDAVIGGLTTIRANTILKDRARAFTSFVGLGEFEPNIVLSGDSQNIGDVEQRGASFSTGVYYGFVDQAAATNPKRGSTLEAAVPEVTATPNFVWY